MAHTCPDCGCLCHCGGDIDDIDFGEDSEGAMDCMHFQRPECGHDDHEDDYYVDPNAPSAAHGPKQESK